MGGVALSHSRELPLLLVARQPYRKHLHHLVSEVVDHFQRNTAGVVTVLSRHLGRRPHIKRPPS